MSSKFGNRRRLYFMITILVCFNNEFQCNLFIPTSGHNIHIVHLMSLWVDIVHVSMQNVSSTFCIHIVRMLYVGITILCIIETVQMYIWKDPTIQLQVCALSTHSTKSNIYIYVFVFKSSFISTAFATSNVVIASKTTFGDMKWVVWAGLLPRFM